MKYLSQFCIILGFTFAGEALQRLLPLPIPGSVWGLALLFGALCLGLVKTEQVREVSGFLVSIMPILFVAPTVGIVENWDMISHQLLPLFLLLVSTTFLTFGISGRVAQWVMGKGGRKDV